MTRLALIIAHVCWFVCQTAAAAAPSRVVSLDYCADQFVLKLLPRARILAVSPDAEKAFSYMRASASGLQTVRPLAEDVLTLEPDLVVRSYGGGPNAAAFFERAGLPLLQIPYAANLAEIRDAIRHVSSGLQVHARGAAVIDEMDRRLAAVVTGERQRTALYMTPAGVTSGPGTLIHEMLLAAGLTNFQAQDGWRSIPLERLAYERPDLIAAAFFDARTNHPGVWSPMRHPVARRQISEQPTVMLQGAWTSCGSWFLLDAIEALAAANTVVAR